MIYSCYDSGKVVLFSLATASLAQKSDMKVGSSSKDNGKQTLFRFNDAVKVVSFDSSKTHSSASTSGAGTGGNRRDYPFLVSIL